MKYRIMIARNGFYYGQRRNRFGCWSRCTPFRMYRSSVRQDIYNLRRDCRVVEYL